MRFPILFALVACHGKAHSDSEGDPDDSDPDTVTDETDNVPPDTDTDVGPGPSPVVLQGELVEVTLPADPWLAGVVAVSEWGAPGTRITLHVSEGAEPVSGLSPQVVNVAAEAWTLAEVVPGRYELAADQQAGFGWTPFTEADVQPGAIGAWDGVASAYMPAYAIPYVPSSVVAGSPLTVDFGKQGFHSGLAVVLDGTGATTWTDAPVTLADLVAVNATDVQEVTIPGSAFPAPGEYVVGLAGCVRTLPVDLDQLDPGSAVRAGRMAFWRVYVAPAP